MRRYIIAVAVFVLVPFLSEAQNYIPRTNNVSVSVVHKTKIKKSFQTYDVIPGFRHFVDIGSSFDFVEDKDMTGFNYIGGYRFNRWIFAGVGTGLNFAHYHLAGAKEHVGGTATVYVREDYLYENAIYESLGIENGNGSFGKVSVPLYLHLRGYYMNTRFAPYSSLSLGGILASKESGFYMDFSTGVDFRIEKDPAKSSKHAYLAVGFWLRGHTRYCNLESSSYSSIDYDDSRRGYNGTVKYYGRDEMCDNRACPIESYSYGHCHFYLTDLWNRFENALGLSVRLGISF